MNIFAWLFILWRKPFELGDRIQIGEHRGDVIDQRVFQFTLAEIGNWVDADQSTGRVIHIPNGKVFSVMLANYSKGFQYIWEEIPVLITFESNWEKAKGILRKMAEKHSEHLSESAKERVKAAARRYLIVYKKLTPTVYTTVRDSGVLLTMRYLCEPKNRRGSTQDIWEDVLREFAYHDDIDFAYPTTRYYSEYFDRKSGREEKKNVDEEEEGNSEGGEKS
jgi:small-conductance mechanosensitive channel